MPLDLGARMPDEAKPPGDAREEALALIDAWHAESPGTRFVGKSVRIASVTAQYVHVVAVTRIAEVRGVLATRTSPARWDAERAFAQAEPDPWSVAGLDFSDAALVGEMRAHVVADATPMLSACEVCGGTTRVTCRQCDGSGQVYVKTGRTTGHYIPCPQCGGTSSIACQTCEVLGGFTGPPQAWSKIVEITNTRWLADEGAPSAAMLDVDAKLPDAPVILRLDPWRVDEASARGYRDASESRFFGPARELVAEQDANHRANVRRRRLEVRRIGVYTVTLGDGRTLHLWGPPARLSPPDGLDGPSRSMLRVGWIALSVSMVSIALALAWFLATR